ncbi:MAG: hypothetical protein PHI87_00110 [Candidatus Methanomethylophilus sp.]|nr:hypothetical protein [Methanomethylophilus sp.]
MKLPRFLQAPVETITRAKSYLSINKRVIWENKKREIGKLRKFRAAYENGGYISEAIDLYPLYMLSNGYALHTEDGVSDEARKNVQKLLDSIDINKISWMLTVDSLVVMDGLAEIVFGKGSLSKVPIAIYNRPAECFDFAEDAYGNIIAYIQHYDTDGNSIAPITLEPKNTIHLKLIPRSDASYGLSLMRRAEDDINRDIDCIESIAKGIKIHGTPKYLTRINANSPDAPPLSDTEFDTLKKEFEDINAKDSFVVEGDIETSMLDVAGVTGVQEYSAVTLERVCAALGIPEELVGMRKGSSDATAVSRINAFFKKIQTFQMTLAQAINTAIIDPAVGQPGKIWIVFNDPDPSDNLKEAQYVESLGRVDPLDAFSVMSAEQMRSRLGIDEDEYKKNTTGTGV